MSLKLNKYKKTDEMTDAYLIFQKSDGNFELEHKTY